MRRGPPGRDPGRRSPRRLLLEIDLARDAVRVPLQRERPVAQMREDRVRGLLVVAEDIALRDPVVREEHAVGTRQPDLRRHQKTTVRLAYMSTRSSRCAETARASTTRSMSRPIRTRSC